MRRSLSDSSLYIIFYIEKGKSRNSVDDLAKQFLDYVVRNRGIDPVRVSITIGGIRKSQTTELWIVPKKVDSPKATPDEAFKAEKFAEIGIVSIEELENKVNEFDYETNKVQSDTGYIITYGTEEEIYAREKYIRDVLRLKRYDTSRIVLISIYNGESLRTVFWLVPYGATPPTP